MIRHEYVLILYAIIIILNKQYIYIKADLIYQILNIVFISTICISIIVILGFLYTLCCIKSKKIEYYARIITNIQTSMPVSIFTVCCKYCIYFDERQIYNIDYILLMIGIHSPYYMSIMHHGFIKTININASNKEIYIFKKYIYKLLPFICITFADIINEAHISIFNEYGKYTYLKDIKLINIHNFFISFFIFYIYKTIINKQKINDKLDSNNY